MLRIYFQCLLIVKVRFFKIVSLKMPNRKIKCRFKIRKLFKALLAPMNPVLNIIFTLYNPNIIKGLNIFRAKSKGYFISLNRQLKLSNKDISICDIIPDIRTEYWLIFTKINGPLKASKKDFPFIISHTANSEIIPYLSRVISKLKKPLVHFHSYLSLIFIIQIRGE